MFGRGTVGKGCGERGVRWKRSLLGRGAVERVYLGGVQWERGMVGEGYGGKEFVGKGYGEKGCVWERNSRKGVW